MPIQSDGLGFRILGAVTSERRLVDWRAAFAGYAACDERARSESESYLSAFTFGDEFRAHLTATGTTRGYRGPCGAAFVWFDIDRDAELDAARIDTARLAACILERFALDAEDVLAFFSGSKGFHLGIPTTLWTPPPSIDFHRIARRFAETIATAAGVTIDTGVYDSVRAFRAPNSRHPKTGLHKRRVPIDALMHRDAATIAGWAKHPEAFDVPTPGAGRCDWNIAADWNEAADAVRREAEATAARRDAVASGDIAATLNRQTLAFIRDGATAGDRHRLLYSAARNLGEFGCSPALATALLTEAALDSGLSPSDVRRQIDCGLKDAIGGAA